MFFNKEFEAMFSATKSKATHLSKKVVDKKDNEDDVIKVFTAFTGVGSQEMALRNANIPFEVVGISEVDKHALVAYDAIHCEGDVVIPSKGEILEEIKEKNIAYNFSTMKCEIPKKIDELEKLYAAHKRTKNYGDITKINENSLPDFDLFTYSFPCKNISVAGSQAGLEEGSGTQSSLVWECERIIRVKKPKYLLMENVKNLISENHYGYFMDWVDVLKELGYNSYHKVLNAKSFGVPQNRERVMMISILKEYDQGEFEMPQGWDLEISLKDVLEDVVDEYYYYKKEKYEHLDKPLPHQDVSFCIDAHYNNSVPIDYFIKKCRRQLVQVGRLNNSDHTANRVYDSSGLCPTINSMNGGDREPKMWDSDRIRKLTPIECWRLMGYSDEDFERAKEAGLTRARLYERAGRGIAVPMLEEIFKNLWNSQNENKI